MAAATVPCGLESFHACTRDWFRQAFAAPTEIQTRAWPPIAAGRNTLLLAPTGSGKTLAAFLAAIDRLFFAAPTDRSDHTRGESPDADSVRVLYLSPLKALGVDVNRNLRAPIAGLRAWAERQQVPYTMPSVAVRTGDTSQRDRSRIVRHPPEILITTPESLYLMLTSAASRVLCGVECVIVDEIHALAGTKRGAHLFTSLERLERIRRETLSSDLPADRARLQRIGLSATQRPLEEIARLLGGGDASADPSVAVRPRPVDIIDSTENRRFKLTIETPAEESSESEDEESPGDLSGPAVPSVWPSIHPRLVDLIREHRSTMVFVNSRRLAERLASAINELAEEEIALAHHGSISKDARADIEDRLKRGDLPAIVATSSMELGIDMGAVDLVIQIEAPPSIASGIQRIGRAGHQVGTISTGVIFPKYRGDLLACSAASKAMREGWVEETQYPRNPLDILAQQIVAMTCRDAMHVDDVYATVRCAAPFFDLPHSSFVSVLDLLSGRYPSDEFSGLRPRINWDRVSGIVSPRQGSQRLAILNGGTIPDRGLYGVYLIGEEGASGSRVGELDEEMVFECRPGDVFLLGASSWRVMDITRDRVLVVPAPGEPGRMPFWKGDSPGRPLDFGIAIGKLARELVSTPHTEALRRLTEDYGLQESASTSLIRYLTEQQQATVEIPSDVTIVIESFTDEVGDWRIVVLSPFGARVHAPWAMLIAARMRREVCDDVDLMWTDDGIVFRLPDAFDVPPAEFFFPEPDDVEEELVREIGGTSMFAARFRENAARALLLPRRSPNRRTPLWQQRRRAHELLKVAAKYHGFPMIMETCRECLRDALDMGGFRRLLEDVRAGRIRVRSVRSEAPSPFAGAVLFNYVGNFIYDGDAPLAERRAQTLSLDFSQLRELLGAVNFRELLDADVVEQVERDLQRLSGRHLRHDDDLHALLLDLGTLSRAEIKQRCSEKDVISGDADDWLGELEAARRIFRLRVGDSERFAAAEDAGKLRDALGIMPPPGLADAFLEPVGDALRDLVSRYARTHIPFRAEDVAQRLGLGVAPVLSALTHLAEQDRVVEGEFLPHRTGSEWCDINVLRLLKRRTLAALRKQVEPVEPVVLARFLPDWHGVTRRSRGLDGLLDAIEQLQGAPLSAAELEEEILPARLDAFRPADLDELCLQREVIWRGFGSTGGSDGKIGLYLTDSYLLLSPPADPVDDPSAETVRSLLASRGALLFDDLQRATGEFPNDLLATLWQMVWAGEVTNDTLTPLRTLRSDRDARHRRATRHRRFRSRRETRLPGSEGRWALLPGVTPAGAVDPAPSDGKSSEPGSLPTETERRMAMAMQLVERHGILSRAMLGREEIAGGFAGLYPLLKAMEEAGKIRRGYFVEGLGGAQFAASGAEDRLRSFRDDDDEEPCLVLAATDPASPWGSVLPWPESKDGNRPRRESGARVILHNGRLLAWLARSRESLTTFLPDDEDGRSKTVQTLAAALAGLARPGQALLLATIDGSRPEQSYFSSALIACGFTSSSRGYLHRGHFG